MQFILHENQEFTAQIIVGELSVGNRKIVGWLLLDDERIVPLIFDDKILELVTVDKYMERLRYEWNEQKNKY